MHLYVYYLSIYGICFVLILPGKLVTVAEENQSQYTFSFRLRTSTSILFARNNNPYIGQSLSWYFIISKLFDRPYSSKIRKEF